MENPDWQNAGSFHAFYPKSEQFASFIGKVKPFAAGPAVPELYEQPQERSIACTSSAVTQVIKVKASAGASDGVGGSSKDTEDAWAQLVAAIKASTTTTTGAKFYHANGIEKDKDTFLGLIGWSNLQVNHQLRNCLLFSPSSRKTHPFGLILSEPCGVIAF